MSRLLLRNVYAAVRTLGSVTALPGVTARLWRSIATTRVSMDAAATSTTASSSPKAAGTSATEGDNTNPANHIDNFQISPRRKALLKSKFNITNFYPIQAEVYPLAMEGVDIIGRSRTGTGKTLAFALPVVELLEQASRRPSPGCCTVLILEPTRELALQVTREIEKLQPQFDVVTVYGGAPYDPQERKLRQGVQFLVATPGRLRDFMERRQINFKETACVVIDEADEMLKVGFQEHIEAILREMPDSRQTLLFSATLPPWVKNIARNYLKNNVRTVDTIGDHSMRTSLTVTHKAICAPSDIHERGALIGQIVQKTSSGRVIIFTRTKAGADDLASHPSLAGVARPLHGDVSQGSREATLAGFRAGKFRVLVATDVAARGLDIPEVELIIQAEFPDQVEPYIHRSGRTGRAGRTGTSIIVHSLNERPYLKTLERQIGSKIQIMYPPQSSSDSSLVQKEASTLIARWKNQAPLFVPLAEKLEAEHGDKALPAILASLFSSAESPRSILASAPGFTTVLIHTNGWLTKRVVLDKLERFLGKAIESGDFQSFPGGAAVDITTASAKELEEKVASEPLPGCDVKFPTELPPEIVNAPAVGNELPQSRGSFGRRGGGGGGFRDRDSREGGRGGRSDSRSGGRGGYGVGGGSRDRSSSDRRSGGSRY